MVEKSRMAPSEDKARAVAPHEDARVATPDESTRPPAADEQPDATIADQEAHPAAPALDDWRALASPPDWDAVFGFSGPLDLEIGSGKGHFAAAFGARHPDRRLVTLEVRRHYAQTTRARAEKAGLTNVLPVHADAKLFAPRLIAPASLAAIHLYFPDPWWKQRHFKRRVIEPAFARTLLGLLEPGGLFFVRTDVEARALDMLRGLEAAGFENAVAPGAFAPFDPGEVPTTRERRYLEGDEPVWRLRLRRPSGGGRP